MAAARPLVLTIMDGWGHNPDPANNAVALARTPTFDRLWRSNPHTLIRTDGPFVGLPQGQMGNSEVGHLNIGSGRIIQMDITRIDEMVRTGTLGDSPVLQRAMAHARDRALHLLGLVSDGGVHSQATHLYALLEIAKRHGVENVYLHAFTDGRDTPPNNGSGYLRELQETMARIGCGRIATLGGRYYAMDRDRRWDRVERAYRAIVDGEGTIATDPVAAIEASYADGVTDEFVVPTVFVDPDGRPAGRVRDGDAVVFFNFRADRAREMTAALNDPDLEGVDRSSRPENLHYVTMTRYERSYPYPVIVEPQFPERILGELCEEHGWTNLRVAETEKYPPRHLLLQRRQGDPLRGRGAGHGPVPEGGDV